MQDDLKKLVIEALDDPTAQVSIYRGMRRTDSKKKGATETFEPTDAKTFVIELHGGSNNVRIQNIKTEDDEDESGGR